ncbi:MAG: MGMT family protein [Cyanobacteria bacterium J06635_1]
MPTGVVRQLFVKRGTGQPMQPVETLNLIAGNGIQEDVNANPMSPRQLLVVRQENLDEFAIAPGVLRENIVVAGLKAEAVAPGAKLIFNGGVTVRLTFYCEPCQRVKPWVPSLKQIEQKRGILGIVLAGGNVISETPVQSEPNAFAPIPEEPYQRFLQLVARIPTGKIVTYQQIITSIGVTRSYYRVLPLYLKKALKETSFQYPIHRVVDSKGDLLPYVPHQIEQLAAEGLQISKGVSQASCLGLATSIWQNPKIYGD